MNISALLVHELGHQVLNVYAMNYFGYTTPFYVTEATRDAFAYYITDSLKDNQTVPQLVLNSAYELWKNSFDGSYEEFTASISGYATGVQYDGGISYSETVAEALTDIYLNGEEASYASKCIESALKEQKYLQE